MPARLALFCIFWWAMPADAQFQLFAINGGVETPAAPVHNLGSFYQNELTTARYRLRNISSGPVTVYVLAADGAGFALAGAPPLPVAVANGAALDFAVIFSSPSLGTFSATLRCEGLSILITATVVPRLTYTADGRPLGTEIIDFGQIELGAASEKRFRVENQNPVILTIPPISVQGSAFAIVGPPPAGQSLQPRQFVEFDLRFAPSMAGVHSGALILGDRDHALRGVAVDAPLPRPILSIDLPDPRSGRQGTLTVRLDQASRTRGAGRVTLEFRPLASGAADPGIAFATGGQALAFEVSPGDTQPLTVPFQTGTTAGSLSVTVTLGGATDNQTLTIPAEAVAISSAVASRSPEGIEVRIAGFDNTRTIGPSSYTFFDTAGAVIQPGAIHVDSGGDFTRFFPSSGSGGNFVLRAVFPVKGDASRISGCEAELTNSAGTARTPRVTF